MFCLGFTTDLHGLITVSAVLFTLTFISPL